MKPQHRDSFGVVLIMVCCGCCVAFGSWLYELGYKAGYNRAKFERVAERPLEIDE